ncbi:TATA box-binding protein-associated factor RNA polymerase I subunit B [Frankliniella occidentalis]|uniref:TATA box-binding protein-associated factor RNA polymerase I subunit B n=1 Tax=Frankliniella occidentalis TaxID=133901 RepID=A0A9C6WNJ1_FRAOC|nr:TATA box-binding protein-associated factor RNA polymerase I subunit B [Frankliniella occidentalis]
MPVCTVCTGTDFICESGYYFCNECQTQSQDVREEVNENDDGADEGKVIGGKRRKSAKFFESTPSEDEDASITTWEGFNYALVGLVDELILLGAKPSLKLAVLKLWTSYLGKMEVAFFTKNNLTVPKLGPNFNKSDANIIYGYVREKRKSTKTKEKSIDEQQNEKDCNNSLDETGVDDPLNESLKRKKTLKQKNSAFHQNYERMLAEMSTASQTLTDVTLDMLSVSEVDDKGPKELQFNSDAKKKEKVLGSLQSHPGILVRNKLICLLYLGILETHDEEINLSDLLRWISEGHLSYCNLSKFFPLGTKLHTLNKALLTRYQPTPTYGCILVATQHIAAYLGIKTIKVPSFRKLIKRFVQELNLPEQVALIAERLFDMLPKPVEYVPVSLRKSLPNWEGRAMAHIIVAVKLLFGLDDATEHRNSRIARRFNELIASQNSSVRLFVWDDWEQFCVLRRTALSLLHEPSFVKANLSTSMVQNVNPIISAWKKSLRVTNDDAKRSAVIQDTYRHISKKLLENPLSNPGNEKNVMLSFPASLIPYTSYTKHIIKKFQEGGIECDDSDWSNIIAGLNIEMLSEDFKLTTVSYLTHPEKYIEWAQQYGLRIGLHSGSAVSTIKLPEKQQQQALTRNAYNNFFRVKLHLDQVDRLPVIVKPKQMNTTPLRLFSLHKPLIFPKVVNKAIKDPFPCVTEMDVNPNVSVTTPGKRGRPKIQRKSYENLPKEDEDNMLHVPHTEYWMLQLTGRASADYVHTLPGSFQRLLEECCSLIEMEPAHLCKEVTYLEKLHRDLAEHTKPDKGTVVNCPFGTDRLYMERVKEDYWL